LGHPSFQPNAQRRLTCDYRRDHHRESLLNPTALIYDETMATVLRRDGFDFRIYTKDHEPGHVHIVQAGEVVIVVLTNPVTIRE
jgi:hypothetical protein